MPQRRPGIRKKDYNLEDHIVFFIEGIGVPNRYGIIDDFDSWEQLEEAWRDNKKYLLNLYFYGSEKGFIGDHPAGTRPAGWWYAKSPIKNIIREDISGVVGENVYIDRKYFEVMKDYALDPELMKYNHKEFQLDQEKYLRDNDLLFKWEETELQQN